MINTLKMCSRSREVGYGLLNYTLSLNSFTDLSWVHEDYHLLTGAMGCLWTFPSLHNNTLGLDLLVIYVKNNRKRPNRLLRANCRFVDCIYIYIYIYMYNMALIIYKFYIYIYIYIQSTKLSFACNRRFGRFLLFFT